MLCMNKEQIVLSTRIRLARNYSTLPFPFKMSAEQANQVIQTATNCMLNASLKAEETFQLISGEELTRMGGMLLEKHLISPNLMQTKHPCGVIVSKDETISVMLNEEDHIRIQVIYPGYELKRAFQQAEKLDYLLEEDLGYAFHEQYGYLTACPTNIGTGLRASVMMHLPGIVMANRINELIEAVSKFGITVRGIYGEGSEALGNLFQISNQVTLGLTEAETIERLEQVVNQIIQQETTFRKKLQSDTLTNQIMRSYGVLKYAYLISYQEFINLWSNVRLGMSTGVLPNHCGKEFNELLWRCGPYTLSYQATEPMDAPARDRARAEILRQTLK